jgi:DNA-binding NarL/FixJ family response regulator
MPVSIVLADDHPIVRRGSRALLESEPDFDVIGEAGDGLEAVRVVERLRPDVLILDLMLPGLHGLEVLRIIRDRLPRTRVVVFSMHSTNAFVAEALRVGVDAYVLKGGNEDDLVRAVREVHAGRRFLCSRLAGVSLEEYDQQARSGTIDPHETLTPREREVLQLVAEGRTSIEIAGILHISPRTVENHRAKLLRKLRLQNHTDLVRHAIKHGMITLDA